MQPIRLILAALMFAALGAPPTVSAQDFLGKSLKQWQADLKSDDAQVRRSAAFALGQFPDDANRVVPLLLERLQDGDAGVRDAAGTALGDLMQSDKDKPRAYWAAARAVLAKRLGGESDAQALRGVLHAVGGFGESALPLLDAVQDKLTHKSAAVRQNAAWALGRMGPKAEAAVEALTARLKDDEALVRRDAATALGAIGLPAARPAVGPLFRMVEKEDDEVARNTALEQLINLVGPEDKDAAKQLDALLDSKDPDTANLAAFVLAKIGGGGEEVKKAVEVLRKALHDDEPQVRGLAAASLGALKAMGGPAAADLGKALRSDGDKDVRRNCAVALALIGPEAPDAAKEALPDLLTVLDSDAPIEIRHYTAEAIAKMGPANDTKETRAVVLRVLAKSGPDDSRPGDRYTLNSMRQRCIWCFFNVRDLPDDPATVLTAILDETSESGLMVRYDAARMLATYRRENAPDKAVDWLLHMLRNENLQIYRRTESKVSGGSTESSSGGATVQQDAGGDARFLAAQALSRMGSKAAGRKDVIDELKKAADEAKDERLRTEAKKALERLGK
jgi:HEAT repeat protein